MKNDDLTQVKHIGTVRMQVLKDSGITTLKQLYEIPLEKLARIETIGEHYAKLIKEAVTEVYDPSYEILAETIEPAKETKIEKIDQNLQKQIKLLNKSLKQAHEKLKPLGKKKYLELYVDFKKRSKILKTRLKGLNQLEGSFPNKVKKKVTKKADTLNTTLKNIGKKPKKKTYKTLSQEIQSISKMLRDTSS